MMTTRKCPECNEPIYGRIDKKYCSDYCRNTYNNRVNKDSTNLIRNINNRLRKNWRILEKLNPTNKRKVSKQQMDAEGFDFNYFTSTYTTQSKKQYHFVYNQGYAKIDEHHFVLVKRD